MKLIRHLFVLCFIAFFSFDAFSDVHVRGYYRKDGTYVRPHYRSAPDSSIYNNYSYRGISKVHNNCSGHGHVYSSSHNHFNGNVTGISMSGYNVNKWFSYNTMKVVSVADSSKSPDKISIERISSNNFALCLNINQKQKLPLSIESTKRPESKWIGSKMKGYTSQVDFNDCYRISTDFIKTLRGGAFLKIDNTYYLRYSLKGFSSTFDSKFNS